MTFEMCYYWLRLFKTEQKIRLKVEEAIIILEQIQSKTLETRKKTSKECDHKACFWEF